MKDYLAMDSAQLQQELAAETAAYAQFKAKELHLDMSRGKPSPAQLDLSMDMLDIHDYKGKTGIDARNYGNLEGMPEARSFFAELLGVQPCEVIAGGNSSLNMMFNLVELAWRKGFADSEKPWCKEEKVKFLCPAPGYDRHFRVTQDFGFELITVPMLHTGPDMDTVELLVKDPAVKGIWVVPQYSNPDGYTCSDETVRRLASMPTAAKDFTIFWDNAYLVHHLNDTPDMLLNIMDECKKAGTQNRVLEFCSLSKVTFPGAGVAAMAASEQNVAYILDNMMPMLISYDKFNQLRHVLYLKDAAGVAQHMKKHRAILEPKFSMVQRILKERLACCGRIAHWTKPNGGYFISLFVQPGCAKRTVQLCKQAGVVLTGAGAAYPYGIDPQDSNIRIAPTFPPVTELETASELLCVCVKIATLEQLLKA